MCWWRILLPFSINFEFNFTDNRIAKKIPSQWVSASAFTHGMDTTDVNGTFNVIPFESIDASVNADAEAVAWCVRAKLVHYLYNSNTFIHDLNINRSSQKNKWWTDLKSAGVSDDKCTTERRQEENPTGQNVKISTSCRPRLISRGRGGDQRGRLHANFKLKSTLIRFWKKYKNENFS